MQTQLRLVYLLASVASLGRDVVAIFMFGAGDGTDAVYLGLLPFMLLGSLVAADSMDNVIQPVLGARCGDGAIGSGDVWAVRAWAARTGLIVMALTLPLFAVVAATMWGAGGDQIGLAVAAAALSCPATYLTARSNVLASMVRRERHQVGVAYSILGMNIAGAILVAGLAVAGLGVFSIAVSYLGSSAIYGIMIRVVALQRLPKAGMIGRGKPLEGGTSTDDLRRALNRSARVVMTTASLGHLNLLGERLVSVFFGAGVMTAVQYGRKFCSTAGGLLGGVQAVVDYPEWTRRGTSLEVRRILEVAVLGAIGGSAIIGLIQVVPGTIQGSHLIRSAVSAFAIVLPLYCVFVYAQRYLFAINEVRTVMWAMIVMAVLPLPVILAAAFWFSPVTSIAAGFGCAVTLNLSIFWSRIAALGKGAARGLTSRV